jgi:hypothetical protein
MENMIINGITYIPVQEKSNYVIVRGDRSGVFAGYIKPDTENGRDITLFDCRRIYYWSGAASLSQMAVNGVSNPNSCKFPVAVQEIRIKDVIEVIPCTEKARESIQNVPIWSA